MNNKEFLDTEDQENKGEEENIKKEIEEEIQKYIQEEIKKGEELNKNKYNTTWLKNKIYILQNIYTTDNTEELGNYCLNIINYYKHRITEVKNLIQNMGNTIKKNISGDLLIQKKQEESLPSLVMENDIKESESWKKEKISRYAEKIGNKTDEVMDKDYEERLRRIKYDLLIHQYETIIEKIQNCESCKGDKIKKEIKEYIPQDDSESDLSNNHDSNYEENYTDIFSDEDYIEFQKMLNTEITGGGGSNSDSLNNLYLTLKKGGGGSNSDSLNNLYLTLKTNCNSDTVMLELLYSQILEILKNENDLLIQKKGLSDPEEINKIEDKLINNEIYLFFVINTITLFSKQNEEINDIPRAGKINKLTKKHRNKKLKMKKTRKQKLEYKHKGGQNPKDNKKNITSTQHQEGSFKSQENLVDNILQGLGLSIPGNKDKDIRDKLPESVHITLNKEIEGSEEWSGLFTRRLLEKNLTEPTIYWKINESGHITARLIELPDKKGDKYWCVCRSKETCSIEHNILKSQESNRDSPIGLTYSYLGGQEVVNIQVNDGGIDKSYYLFSKKKGGEIEQDTQIVGPSDYETIKNILNGKDGKKKYTIRKIINNVDFETKNPIKVDGTDKNLRIIGKHAELWWKMKELICKSELNGKCRTFQEEIKYEDIQKGSNEYNSLESYFDYVKDVTEGNVVEKIESFLSENAGYLQQEIVSNIRGFIGGLKSAIEQKKNQKKIQEGMGKAVQQLAASGDVNSFLQTNDEIDKVSSEYFDRAKKNYDQCVQSLVKLEDKFDRLSEEQEQIDSEIKQICENIQMYDSNGIDFENLGNVGTIMTAKEILMNQVDEDNKENYVKYMLFNFIKQCDGLDSIPSWRAMISNTIAGYLRSVLKKKNKKGGEEIVTLIPSYDHFNIVLMGTPGIGKSYTSVIVGKVLKFSGLLTSGNLVTKLSTDFKGSVVGETGPKTYKSLSDGLGDILFIDEAYTIAGPKDLSTGTYNSYGQEAIDAITDYTSNHIGLLGIVAAGYKYEMETQFLDVNIGIPRRFPKQSNLVLNRYDMKTFWKILSSNLNNNLPWELYSSDQNKNHHQACFQILNIMFNYQILPNPILKLTNNWIHLWQNGKLIDVQFNLDLDLKLGGEKNQIVPLTKLDIEDKEKIIDEDNSFVSDYIKGFNFNDTITKFLKSIIIEKIKGKSDLYNGDFFRSQSDNMVKFSNSMLNMAINDKEYGNLFKSCVEGEGEDCMTWIEYAYFKLYFDENPNSSVKTISYRLENIDKAEDEKNRLKEQEEGELYEEDRLKEERDVTIAEAWKEFNKLAIEETTRRKKVDGGGQDRWKKQRTVLAQKGGVDFDEIRNMYLDGWNIAKRLTELQQEHNQEEERGEPKEEHQEKKKWNEFVVKYGLDLRDEDEKILKAVKNMVELEKEKQRNDEMLKEVNNQGKMLDEQEQEMMRRYRNEVRNKKLSKSLDDNYQREKQELWISRDEVWKRVRELKKRGEELRKELANKEGQKWKFLTQLAEEAARVKAAEEEASRLKVGYPLHCQTLI